MEEPETLPELQVGRQHIVRNKKYAPATGIQSDFEKILTTFVETKSVRYEEFVTIWKEKKLSLICAGRQSDREAVEFMEECMKVAIKMLLPPYGFQARVGALYLLYGLYLTQPCLPKVKIRVTLEDWGSIKSLQEELLRQNHHDTNFILHKLMMDGAFYFCALSQEPRSRYSLNEENTSKSLVEALREDRQRIDDLFTDEIQEQLGMIHHRYHHQKVGVAGPDASRPDRSLDVLLDQFPNTVKDMLKHHHEQWKEKERSRHGRFDRTLETIPEGGETTDQEEENMYRKGVSVGQRRARLKAMAYRGLKNKPRYKHRTLHTQETSSETDQNATSATDSSPKKKRGRPKGSKNVNRAAQRAAMDTIAEQEEETAVATETAKALLDMPLFETEETKKPGRKRRNKANSETTARPPKQQKTSDDNDALNQTSDPSPSTSQPQETATPQGSPTKRRPGRPPKPKPGGSLARVKRPVGRPKKTQDSETSNVQENLKMRGEKKKRGRRKKSGREGGGEEEEMGEETEKNTGETETGKERRRKSSGRETETAGVEESEETEKEQNARMRERVKRERKKSWKIREAEESEERESEEMEEEEEEIETGKRARKKSWKVNELEESEEMESDKAEEERETEIGKRVRKKSWKVREAEESEETESWKIVERETEIRKSPGKGEREAWKSPDKEPRKSPGKGKRETAKSPRKGKTDCGTQSSELTDEEDARVVELAEEESDSFLINSEMDSDDDDNNRAESSTVSSDLEQSTSKNAPLRSPGKKRGRGKGGEGKGAKLRVTPLQVAIVSGRGKKK